MKDSGSYIEVDHFIKVLSNFVYNVNIECWEFLKTVCARRERYARATVAKARGEDTFRL